jgi:hypothetical protein
MSNLRSKKSGRLVAVLVLPFLLIIAAGMSVAGGAGASAAASCQIVANGTVSGAGSGGAAGALTPLQVEQDWVAAGGPLSGAVTAAALADAESADIADRIQGSSETAPTVPGPGTPSDAKLVGYGLWQITPGSPADYDANENAKIAVGKYDESLAAGAGGWSPWTTYGTARYQDALPAAQAAFSQLTAAGGPGVSAGAGGATTTTGTGTAGATTTTPTTAPTASISTTTADNYITRLEGDHDAQYAIVEANGTVLASHEPNTQVNGGLITDAMLLVAYLRAHPSSVPTGTAASNLKAMIESASATDANWAYAAVGPSVVNNVASLAHMAGFRINTSAHGYALTQSTVTANDFALFFANVDTLMPKAVESYGMKLLAHIGSANKWGLDQASITGITGSASGVDLQAKGSWSVSQAAQVKTAQFGSIGIAVTTTANSSQSVGQNVIQNIGTDLLSVATADGLGYGIDISGLSASEQTELYGSAATLQASGSSSQCTNVSVSTALPTVPGVTATIEAATGLAAAPTGLPANIAPTIDKLIQAGNTIHSLPYIWGGGHDQPLTQLAAGYDCSGSTSYLLYAGGLLATPEAMVSGDYETWGEKGPGKYVTIFSNSQHVFIEVDGIVMDTAWYSPVQPTNPGSGPRWQPTSTIQGQINGDIAAGNGGFTETHPAGF